MSQPPRRRPPARRRPWRPWVLLGAAVIVLGAALYAAFGRADSTPTTPAAAATGTPASTVTEPAPSATADATTLAAAGETASTAEDPTTETTAAAAPTFEIVSPIPPATRASMDGKSMKDGCPVGFDGLALMHLTYLGFDGKPHVGDLVVAKRNADDVLDIFKQLYVMRYPIQKMELIDRYRNDKGEWADDSASIEDNNTSAFNCRPVTGGTDFSKHSYGNAIDLNPIQNPYVLNGSSSHPASTPFLDRKTAPTPPARRAVLVADDDVVRLFAQHGWEWGGSWSNPIDYQHFSKGGG